MPFVCGNCRYIVWGPTYDPHSAATAPDASIDLCQIVHGPEHHGGIEASGACRFFAPKPIYAALAPIADEYAGDWGEGGGTENADQGGDSEDA